MFILLFYVFTGVAIVVSWILVFGKMNEGPGLKVLLSSAITVVILLVACAIFFTFIIPPWMGID